MLTALLKYINHFYFSDSIKQVYIYLGGGACPLLFYITINKCILLLLCQHFCMLLLYVFL